MSASTYHPDSALPTKFRSDIQGLRAIAVVAVVLYHVGVPFITGGYVGVDVFFVISGYLITTHLLEALEKHKTIKFADFYAKRIRRILPASFVVIILSLIAVFVWGPPLLFKEVWQAAVATSVYLPNYLFAIDGTNYLAETTPSIYQHFWSLGIEEQFYLVWPLVLLGLYKFGLRRRWSYAIAVGALVAVSLGIGVIATPISQPWAFFSLPTRAWELGAGSLVAIILINGPLSLSPRWTNTIGWVGAAGLLFSIFKYNDETVFPGVAATLPVVSTALIVVSGAIPESGGVGRVLLSWRPMQWTGKISYSLYLVHWPLLVIPQLAAGYENPLSQSAKLALGVISILLAWVMFHTVETPFRQLSWIANARPRRSLILAGSLSIITVLFSSALYAVQLQRDLNGGPDVLASGIEVQPVGTPYVPHNLTPSLNSVSTDQPVVYEDGCHLDYSEIDYPDCTYGDPSDPVIYLFGDSHAAQWFPAISTWAETNGYSVKSRTKSSCASVDVKMMLNGAPYEECQEWRQDVIQEIAQDSPTLVILANFAASPYENDDAQLTWMKGLERTLADIDARVVYLADNPQMKGTPSICLSQHLGNAEECGSAFETSLDLPFIQQEQEAVQLAGDSFLNMNKYLCSSDWCPAIIGNNLVYRDAHHLTATFSGRLSGVFGAEIEKLLSE